MCRVYCAKRICQGGCLDPIGDLPQDKGDKKRLDKRGLRKECHRVRLLDPTSWIKEFSPIPATIKIFAIFALVLILNRFRLHLGLSLLIGSVTLALWTDLGPDRKSTRLNSSHYALSRMPSSA